MYFNNHYVMGNGINLQINFGNFMSVKEYDVINSNPRQWLDVIDYMN